MCVGLITNQSTRTWLHLHSLKSSFKIDCLHLQTKINWTFFFGYPLCFFNQARTSYYNWLVQLLRYKKCNLLEIGSCWTRSKLKNSFNYFIKQAKLEHVFETLKRRGIGNSMVMLLNFVWRRVGTCSWHFIDTLLVLIIIT